MVRRVSLSVESERYGGHLTCTAEALDDPPSCELGMDTPLSGAGSFAHMALTILDMNQPESKRELVLM